MILIKFNPEDDAKGAFLLSRMGPILCLPDDTYLCDEEQLRIFNQNNIPYHIVSIVGSKPTYSQKVAAL
jgi:hypothetical protein